MNLKRAREKKGLKREALAEKLGLSVRTIYRCEDTDVLPRNRLVRAQYCRILGLRAS